MIRPYKQHDEQEINKLFHEVFGKERSAHHWEWKYKHNPAGESVMTIADEDGEVAGHVALMPAKAMWHGREVLFGARTDTMVSPRHQGKGLYKQLNNQMLVQANERGMNYLYGYPAEKAKQLFIRYTGAKEIARIPRLMKFNRPSSLALGKFPFLSFLKPLLSIVDLPFKHRPAKRKDSPYSVKQITHCSEEFDVLWEKAKTIAPIVLKRDAAYLNWRFHHHPDKQYYMIALYAKEELAGYAVTSLEEKSFGRGTVKNGTIVDFLSVNSEEVQSALLDAALEQLKEAGIIQTWALEHTNYFKQLRELRFIHKDNPMPLVGKPADDSMNEDDSIENWYITPADVDSF
ncbi:GNAT family N-acetyltransferase [Bacillus mesophilum]|uniref:GNAT family N-acetyltransferase n=1 Tax=Bacillus mesophilum TaxID=1071718 RepID=A0A7V7RMD3_9BACI|nr:GNAT family N-acetyltransferase [Bacillus mesophilum]KAB2332568.1 GNAT family N-acetyltransferase [Bacillus mesophilum]